MTVTGDTDNTIQIVGMVGSNTGVWFRGYCSQGSTVGAFTSQGTWIAPDSGDVVVGGSRGSGGEYGVDTVQVCSLVWLPGPPCRCMFCFFLFFVAHPT